MGVGLTGTLSASPDPARFAAIPYTRGEREENQSEDQQIDIEAHDAAVQIESLSISGPDASSFSVQYGDCENDQLGASNWCDEDVRFQPVSPGPKDAQLIVKSGASGTTTAVPLEGEGLVGAGVGLSSSESQLGEVPLGTAASHTFTVTDSGDYPLLIQQSFLVSGTPKMFPQLSNTCASKIVMPGASCEFTIGFEPATAGEKGCVAHLHHERHTADQRARCQRCRGGSRPRPTRSTPNGGGLELLLAAAQRCRRAMQTPVGVHAAVASRHPDWESDG